MVQVVLQKKLRRVGKHVRKATVHELRSGRHDRSQKQADLVSDDLGCGIRLHAGRICRIFAIFVPTAEWAHIFANIVAALLVCVYFLKKV